MSEYESSEIVKDDKGKQYHIGLKPDEIAQYIMFVGDPARARLVADFFDEIRISKQNREFVCLTGKYKGFDLTVLGTGIGCDNTEIAVIELCQLRYPITIIRCGTCGAIQDDINIGDIVISKGALRLENTSTFFVEESYPAISSHEVNLALIKSAVNHNQKLHFGITATCSGFYGAQSRHIPGFPIKDENLFDRLKKQGIKNYEMETSTLLTLASLRGFRAGTVCVVFASRTKNEFINPDQKTDAEKNAIKITLNAFEIIYNMDKTKGKNEYWIPDI